MAPQTTDSGAPCVEAYQSEQDCSSCSSICSDTEDSRSKCHALPLHIQLKDAEKRLSPQTTPACALPPSALDRRSAHFRPLSCSIPQAVQCPLDHTKRSCNLDFVGSETNAIVNRRFPVKDDEEDCFDADCESSLNGTCSSGTKKSRAIPRAKRQRRRKISSDTSHDSLSDNHVFHNHRYPSPFEDDDDGDGDVLNDTFPHDRLVADRAQSVSKEILGNYPKNGSDVMEGKRSLSFDDDEHSTKQTERAVFSRFNAWDSSPSTVCEDEEADMNASLDFYFHPIQDEDDSVVKGVGNVRKALFDTKDDEDDDDDHDSVLRTPDHSTEQAMEITDESDFELTQRSRQIQMDLRVREMLELAKEAERAAEEGKEKFVGSATKFELGLGLDVGNRVVSSSPESPKKDRRMTMCTLMDGLQCNLNKNDVTTPPPSSGQGLSRARSQFYLNRHTDVKPVPRPKHYYRQNSAPATVMARTVRVRSHNIPSLLSSTGTFFSIAPITESKERISVLELRHIDEVIPPFKYMHSFMKMNFLRKGIKEENLSASSLLHGKKQQHVHKGVASAPFQDHRSTLRQSSILSTVPIAFLPRVPSINMIMKSMSGLSSKEPEKSEKLNVPKSGDETSKGFDDDDADTDLSLEPDDMALDCVSFVSCGDASIDVDSAGENSVLQVACTSSSTINDSSNVEQDSDLIETHMCTLATELYDPSRRRSVSPLPKPPYCLDGGPDLTPKRSCATSKSRWSGFWENISPVRKSISLPSPLRLQFPSSLEYKGGSWIFSNEALASRKLSFRRLSMNEESLHFQPIEKHDSIDEPLEVQKDDLSNGVIISSQSYSQTVLRSTSPLNHFNSDAHSSDFMNLHPPSECVSSKDNLKSGEGTSHNEDKNIETQGTLLCKGHCSKRSFRTSTTLMSGEDSQSSSASKFSDCSNQTSTNNSVKNQSEPMILTVTHLEEKSILNDPISQVQSTDDLSSLRHCDVPYIKPPLHPTAAPLGALQPADDTDVRCYVIPSMNVTKGDLLPTIEASISFPNFSNEDSSELSIISRYEKHGNHCCDSDASSKIAGDEELRGNTCPRLSCNDQNRTISRHEMHKDDHGAAYASSKLEGDDELIDNTFLEVSCTKEEVSGSDNFTEATNKDDKTSTKNLTKHDGHDGMENTQLRGLQKPALSGLDDDSTDSSRADDDMNKSMSFIDLMEKVPSVIGRFRPFRRIKKDANQFKSDVEFVNNYFFTEMEQKSCMIHMDTKVHTVSTDAQNKCGTHPCIDLNCASVMETAFRCLSTQHLTMEMNDSTRSEIEYFQNKKYGNLRCSGMSESVTVGNLVFKAPSLKVFKKHKNHD